MGARNSTLRVPRKPSGTLRAAGLETVPEQSTLWRSWHTRFTNTLRKTVKKAARTILIKAQNADVTVPRESEQILPARGDDVDESVPDDRAILDNADRVTEHVSRVVFPAFSDRGEGCEIHENAYWGLQTYLGLRERLAANEGARSFSTSRLGSDTAGARPSGSRFETSRLNRFERCTSRPPLGS